MRIWFWLWMVFTGACAGVVETGVAADEVFQSAENELGSALDCRGYSPECPVLVIRGEAIQESVFRGLADPSVELAVRRQARRSSRSARAGEP